MRTSLLEHELELLARLRDAGSKGPLNTRPVSFGARVADGVAAMMGSWPFIIIQTGMLTCWIILNVMAWNAHWDPYPFILLNLALSFQAAYAAPFIMMSQNRQASVDRLAANLDYDVNTKAELEIELLHQKIDLLREKEVAELVTIIRSLEQRLPPPAVAVTP
jgi:uncharacterized membrane protein